MRPDQRPVTLDAAEVDALRRAARHRIKQLAGRQLDGEQQQRQEAMRRALRALSAFRAGCELHPPAPAEHGQEPRYVPPGTLPRGAQ